MRGVRGCVSASDPQAAGFNKHPYTVKTVDECLNVATRGGVMCGPDEKAQCSYFIFTNRTIDDKLREADTQYQRGNVSEAVRHLQQAWAAMSPADRKNELLKAEKTPGVFLNGFCQWVLKQTDAMNQLRQNVSAQVIPLPLEGNCWVGGQSVLQDPNVILSEDASTQRGACKYNLFEVPPLGTEGGNAQQKMINMYKRRVAQERKQVDEVKKRLMQNEVALRIAEGNVNPIDMLVEARQVEKDLQLEQKRQPFKKALLDQKARLEKNIAGTKLFNFALDTAKEASGAASQLVAEKKNVVSKLESDINNITWSLDKTNQDERLQNQIATTLGILIVLFILLVVAIIVYYMIGDKAATNVVKSAIPKNSNVVRNLFKSNVKPSVDQSVFGSLFS